MKNQTLAAVAAVCILISGCGREIKQNKNSSLPVTTLSDESSIAEEYFDDSSAYEPAEESSADESSEEESEPDSSSEEEKEPVLEGGGSFEVYEKVRIKDLVTDTNTKLSDPDELIDTDTPGEHTAKIKYTLDGKKGEAELSYSVADTTPPVIFADGSGTTVGVGEPFLLDNVISYGDNYDREPYASYDGFVDTSAEGSYPITVYISDSSGNTLSYSMNVAVTSGGSSTGTNYDRIPFDSFIAQYGGEGRSLGIDVSAWQGSIDFDQVRDAGCEFVIARAGHCGSDHTLGQDSYFYSNIDGARAAGLKVGVYFYSADNSEEEVREHARWLAGLLDGRELDFPVAFDWESFYRFQQYGMSLHDLNRLYDAFEEELTAAGYETMLYGSKNFLINAWEGTDTRTVWLAHYVNETNYEGEYLLWQRCGWGRINGITGDVDLDVLFRG